MRVLTLAFLRFLRMVLRLSFWYAVSDTMAGNLAMAAG